MLFIRIGACSVALGAMALLSLEGCNAAPAATSPAIEAVESSPTIRALKAHYPTDYASLQSRLRALPPDASAERVQETVQAIIVPALQRELPKADAQNSYELINRTYEEATLIRAVDPRACVAFIEGRPSGVVFSKVITPEIQARDFATTSRLLVQAATAPAAPAPSLGDDARLKLIVEAALTLPEPDQKVVSRLLDNDQAPVTAEENRVMCDYNLAFLRNVIRKPQPAAGQLARQLFAKESQP